MKNALTYYGTVKNGEIKLPGRRFRKEVVGAFDGKSIEVLVKRRKKTRSTPQNSYYWGVCIQILCSHFKDFAPDMVVNAELTHNLLKNKFLPIVTDEQKPKIVTPEGEVLEGDYTTTVLTTTEFMDYITLIQNWAAELDIIIPDPNE